MPGILEALILPIPSLAIGGILLFFAFKRIRALSDPKVTPTILDYAKSLGCGGVIGAGMLALLVCTAFLRSGADALERSAFGLRWMAFVGFAAGVYLIEGLLTALPRWTIPPIGAAFAQFLVTVLAYALVSVLFRKVLRIGRT